VLVILSPYFYYIFSAPLPKAPIWPVGLYAADLYFFLLPSPASALGQLGLARRLAADVPNAAYVGYSYLGPVMLAIVAAFAWRRWHEPAGRFLSALFFIVAVMSLGPELTVGGRRLLPMPALVLYGLPLLRNALAARFTTYLALILSLIMANVAQQAQRRSRLLHEVRDGSLGGTFPLAQSVGRILGYPGGHA
jgi:hypothetical protein